MLFLSNGISHGDRALRSAPCAYWENKTLEVLRARGGLLLDRISMKGCGCAQGRGTHAKAPAPGRKGQQTHGFVPDRSAKAASTALKPRSRAASPCRANRALPDPSARARSVRVKNDRKMRRFSSFFWVQDSFLASTTASCARKSCAATGLCATGRFLTLPTTRKRDNAREGTRCCSKQSCHEPCPNRQNLQGLGDWDVPDA